MKTRNTILLAAATLAGLAVTGASGQIVNSAHDFSSYAWSGGEICKPCHTPHFAVGSFPYAPLLNHALTTATYTMFDGTTGTAEVNIDARSRLCMSCHDGTVALDSFGGMTGGNFIPGSARIGTDLRDDHPIGSEAIYPTTTSTSFNPQDASHNVVFAGRSLRLRSWVNPSGTTEYVVGCTTCHTVHNTGNYGHMLRFSNQSSNLCLTCHIK